MKRGFIKTLLCLGMLPVSMGIVSCGDLSHFDDDLGIEGVSPHIVLPVARGTLSLWDVLDSETNDYLEVNEDGVLVVRYKDESILDKDIDVSDFFQMKSQALNFNFAPIDLNAVLSGLVPVLTPGVSIPLPDTVKYDFAFSSDTIQFSDEVSVDELVFSSELQLGIASLPLNYEVQIVFSDVKSGDSVLELKVNGIENQSVDLRKTYGQLKATLPADKKLAITGRLIIPAGETVDLGNPLVFAMNMNLSGMDFIFAKGKFSKELNVDVDEGTFSLASVDFLEEIAGKFKFADPKVSLYVNNHGIGIPVNVDFSMDGSNGNKTETLQLNDGGVFTLIPSPSVTTPVVSTFNFNKSNSTIVEFFSLPPIGDVTYRGKMNVPADVPFGLWNQAKLGIGVDLELPLIFEAQEMRYSDTITELEIGDDVEKLKAGTLRFIVENGIPANLKLSALKMLDANNVELFSLHPEEGEFIRAGKEDAAVKSVLDFVVDEAQMKQLSKSVSIILDVALSTNGVQTIKDSQKLKFKLIVGAEADLTEIVDF